MCDIFFQVGFTYFKNIKTAKKKLTFNPLSANTIKWSNPLIKIGWQQPTNFLSVLDHFVELELKGLAKKFLEITKTNLIDLDKMKDAINLDKIKD